MRQRHRVIHSMELIKKKKKKGKEKRKQTDKQTKKDKKQECYNRPSQARGKRDFSNSIAEESCKNT